MIVAPPFDAGAVKATVAVVAPVADAVPIVGAPGAIVEISEPAFVAGFEKPMAFCALMVKV